MSHTLPFAQQPGTRLDRSWGRRPGSARGYILGSLDQPAVDGGLKATQVLFLKTIGDGPDHQRPAQPGRWSGIVELPPACLERLKRQVGKGCQVPNQGLGTFPMGGAAPHGQSVAAIR